MDRETPVAVLRSMTPDLEGAIREYKKQVTWYRELQKHDPNGSIGMAQTAVRRSVNELLLVVEREDVGDQPTVPELSDTTTTLVEVDA